MGIYRQATAPAYEAGGLWFDSDDNDKPYYGSGGSWVALNPGSLFTDFSDTDHVQDADVLLGQRGSGGVNYLGSQFVKRAASGNFGIDVTSPAAKMHINSNSAALTHCLIGNTNGGVAIGVDAAGAAQIGGFVTSTLLFGNYNAGGAFAEAMRITSGGSFGIGTSTPEAKFTVMGAAGFSGGAGISIYENSTGNNARLRLSQEAGAVVYNATFSAGTNAHVFQIGNAEHIRLDPTGACLFPNGTGWRPGSAGQFIIASDSGGFFHQVGASYYTVTTSGGSTSDKLKKKNIEGLVGMLDKVLSLRGVSYERKWKKSDVVDKAEAGLCIGLIAQEVEKIFPQVVNGEEGQKTLQYDRLIAPVIEAFKEYVSKTDTIISTMSARLAELEARQ